MDGPNAQRLGVTRALPLFLFLLLLLLLLGGLLSLRAASDGAELVQHGRDVSVAFTNLEKTLIDAETGQRGYLVTHDARFLEPYQLALGSWREQLEDVRRLSNDSPAHQETVRLLDRLIDARFAQLAGTMRLSEAGTGGAQLVEPMLDGKRRMDEIRSRIAEAQAEERGLLVGHQAAVTAATRWTVLSFVGAGLVFGLIVAMASLQRRHEQLSRQALDAERRLLQGVLAGIEDGITVQDRAGKLIFVNASGARLVGFSSPEAMLAAPVSEIMRRFEIRAEDGGPFPLDKLPGRAVLEGKPGEPVLMRHRVAGTNDDHWSLVRAHPVPDAAGRVDRVINVYRDVTESHREGEQRGLLLQAVERFNASLDYETTLAVIARELVPTLADWCAVDLLDGGELKRLAVAHVDPAKVALVQEIERRYPSDPSAPGSPREVMKSGKPFVLSPIPAELIRAAAKDAEHLEMIDRLELHSIVAVPMVGRNGPVGTVTLATAESGRTYSDADVRFASALADRAAIAIENARLFRALEDTVAREKTAREAAEEGTRFSDMFIGMVSHDLRNPLSAIGTGAQLVLMMATDDRQRRPAARILTSAQRMARMIDQLLDLTRIRLGKGLSMTPAPMNLGELVRQIVDETEAAHSCTIRVQAVGDTKGQWDADRLAQALSNLLVNAAVHGQSGRAILVHLDGSAPATMLLQIRNSGRIPADLMADIFEPFRGSAFDRGTGGGLGLGLFITREIVQAHGGTITVASDDDEGTVFQVRLPRGQT